jgi:Secretion system C-terminal sorting domain
MAVLDVLKKYAREKRFPINSFHSVRQPYFIDLYGTHCAVGYLVKESGFPEISFAISKKQNYAYVPEIQDKELVQWSIDFGFSLEELALIQPTYAPNQVYTQLGHGANGKITQSISEGTRWFFSGDFTVLDSLPCLNISKYENGQLSCLGSGLEGEINDLDWHSTKGVQATGQLAHNGNYYPIATFLNNAWVYDSIPSRPNTRATAAAHYNSNISYVAIDHPTNSNEQEIWRFLNGNWSLTAIVYGKVNELDAVGSIYGDFDSALVNDNNNWYNLPAKNYIQSTLNGNWVTVVGIVPDEIFCFVQHGNAVFVGGLGFMPNNTTPGVIISRILNGVAQPVMTTEGFSFPYGAWIYDMKVKDNESIYVSGEFVYNYSFTLMKNFAVFYPSAGGFLSQGYFNEAVHTIGLVNNNLFLGGEFSSNLNGGSNPPVIMNRLAQYLGTLSLENKYISQINIHPNPSSGQLFISGIDQQMILSTQIQDLQGKVVLESLETNLEASEINAGIYVVNILLTNGQTVQKRWVKQ